MCDRSLKRLLVAVFSVFLLVNGLAVQAQEHRPDSHLPGTEGADAPMPEEKEELNPGDIIMEHISDNHSFHFFDIGKHSYAISLPVILYSPQKGFSVFSSSRFEHGHAAYNGYKLDAKNKVVPTEAGVTVYDFSMTRNVVQMLIGLILLVVIMTSIAKKYTRNGHKAAPSGFQNAVEPVITFVRDEVAKPNLGGAYEKYMPLLLTIFFFILINNILGLIPGSANVTGNIAFTIILAIISFIIILASTNKHFWGHIFWPPVPGFVKPIMIIVELLGVFTKPFALMVRLFANMVAGHMMITCLILLIFIFAGLSKYAGIGFAPVSIAFTVFIYMIEVLVAFIQAFIFTNLTAVFIGQSRESAHNHDEVHA
jgi:F-type H+-transporting ATPase subunit a